MEKKIGIINRTPPHGKAHAREALDLSLALSAYNESLSLFFIGDGIYQLLAKHQADIIMQKDFQPMLKMLELYDVENIYVCGESLALRNISIAQLVIDVKVLNHQQLSTTFALQDQLLSF